MTPYLGHALLPKPTLPQPLNNKQTNKLINQYTNKPTNQYTNKPIN